MNKLYFHTYFTTAIYKTDMLIKNDIKFLENCIYGEDRIVALHSTYCANRLAVSDDTYYYCNENPASVTRSPLTLKTVESYAKYIDNIFDFIFKMNADKNDIIMLKDNFEHEALVFILLLSDDLVFEFIQRLLPVFLKINSKHYEMLILFNQIKDPKEAKKYAEKEKAKWIFNTLRKNVFKNQTTNL